DTFIEISVKDNGVGIREEDLERILNPFEQVEAGISRRYSGTGVGLALARRLVALHHGIIWAKSEGLGKGADFHVVLPVGSA
ncbi:MAG: histidine kinase, partial [Proteobacteria bacterium]|nr:histidine kinase [Pseudomonadota bacterium]